MHTINELNNFDTTTGESDWTSVTFGNGGFRHGEPDGWPKGYLWHVRRIVKGKVIEAPASMAKRGEILAIRTVGIREYSHTNMQSALRCRSAHKGKPCVFTGTF